MLKTEHIIFYGTLISNTQRQKQLGIQNKIQLIGSTTISGSMYELPTCPGFISQGIKNYEAEIYKILDPEALTILDSFEEYFPDKEEKSRFLRRVLWIPEFKISAWIYYIKESALPKNSLLVEDKTWDGFVKRTHKKLPVNLPENKIQS